VSTAALLLGSIKVPKELLLLHLLKGCQRLLFNKPFDVGSRFADGLADKLGLGPEESFLVLQLLGEAGSISDRTKLLSASAQVAVNLGSAKIRNKQMIYEKLIDKTVSSTGI
jgi:hypothetical protein